MLFYSKQTLTFGGYLFMKKKIKALLLLGLVFLGGCGQASAP